MENMERELPPESVAGRDRLILEIEAAFRDVRRDGGVSWSEARVVEVGGSAEGREAARARDGDWDWHELVENDGWYVASGVAEWNSLDATGFRYYLPAAMLLELRWRTRGGLYFWLTLPLHGDEEIYFGKWSALDGRQRACVRRFLEHMTRQSRRIGESSEADLWEEALESYWDTVSLECL
jgi:hypothetical protein